VPKEWVGKPVIVKVQIDLAPLETVSKPVKVKL
jgi:hypothetical protein